MGGEGVKGRRAVSEIVVRHNLTLSMLSKKSNVQL